MQPHNPKLYTKADSPVIPPVHDHVITRVVRELGATRPSTSEVQLEEGAVISRTSTRISNPRRACAARVVCE